MRSNKYNINVSRGMISTNKDGLKQIKSTGSLHFTVLTSNHNVIMGVFLLKYFIVL